uniref:Dystrophin n=1 Tax=Romanomermis culicivorax TaxID=13658 RepID=A0A915HI79_ROMCU
ELQNQLLVQRDTLNFICSTAEEIVAEKAIGFEALSVQLVNLTPRWSDIERVLNSQLTRLENGYAKLNEWNLKVADLDKWIDQVTDFVHAEQPAVGNLETLKAQLEQSQGLSADIETLKPKMQQVESAVGDLAPQCTPEMKDYLKNRMDDLDKRWTDVIRLTKAKHDGLHDVHTRSQKIFDDIQQLTTWLTSVEEELNSPVAPATGKDLQLLIKKHKQLKDELESRSNTVEAAVCLGEEMVGSLESSPEMAQQLQVQLNSTRNQWSVICQHVHDKLKHLTDSFEHWRELQGKLLKK